MSTHVIRQGDEALTTFVSTTDIDLSSTLAVRMLYFPSPYRIVSAKVVALSNVDATSGTYMLGVSPSSDSLAQAASIVPLETGNAHVLTLRDAAKSVMGMLHFTVAPTGGSGSIRLVLEVIRL